MWLTGRLAPDHKTIADFRRDNGPAIRKVCGRFVLPRRQLGLLGGDALVAVDGSRFQAVNNRDAYDSPAKLARRMLDLESAIGATHFLIRRLGNIRTEISLQVLAHNLKRVIAIVGHKRLIEAMRVA